MDRSYDVIIFMFEIRFFFKKRPRVANFSDMIKISTMFTKTNFKDSNKVKIIKNYLLKCNQYKSFLTSIKFLISVKGC